MILGVIQPYEKNCYSINICISMKQLDSRDILPITKMIHRMIKIKINVYEIYGISLSMSPSELIFNNQFKISTFI